MTIPIMFFMVLLFVGIGLWASEAEKGTEKDVVIEQAGQGLFGVSLIILLGLFGFFGSFFGYLLGGRKGHVTDGGAMGKGGIKRWEVGNNKKGWFRWFK